MASGNGKLGPYFEPGANCDKGNGADSGNGPLTHAVGWLRCRGKSGHTPGCQCRRCALARDTARAAARASDCDCGDCLRCWAAAEIRKGRL